MEIYGSIEHIARLELENTGRNAQPVIKYTSEQFENSIKEKE